MLFRSYDDGGMADDATGVDQAIAANTDTGEWARGENYGDGTTGDERVAMARAPAREASAEEVMAANKFANTPRARPRPAAPGGTQNARDAILARQVKQEVKDQAVANAAPKRTAVGRASQGSVDRTPRNQPTEEGLKSMRAQDAEQRSDLMNSRLMRGIRGLFSTPKTRGGSTYKSGGKTASARADGIAQRGKTRGTMVACGGGYMKGKK